MSVRTFNEGSSPSRLPFYTHEIKISPRRQRIRTKSEESTMSIPGLDWDPKSFDSSQSSGLLLWRPAGAPDELNLHKIMSHKDVTLVDQLMSEFSSNVDVNQQSREAFIFKTVEEALSKGKSIFGYPPVIPKSMAIKLAAKHLVLTVVQSNDVIRVPFSSVKTLIILGVKKIIELIKTNHVIPIDDVILDGVDKALDIGEKMSQKGGFVTYGLNT